jgi:hypothetical protein
MYSIASLVDIERDEGPPDPSPIDALFTATQRRLLGFLFGEPARAFYVRELLAITGTGHGGVQRELRRLQAAGLVRKTRDRARTYYQADAKSPIHVELVALVRKTAGLAEPLRAAFRLAQPRVRLCFAFEPERDPWVPDERDLGLLFVVDEAPEPQPELLEARERAEQLLRRPIWMVTADPVRLRADPFVAEVLQRPRVWVFGDEAGLAILMGRVPEGLPLSARLRLLL